MHQPPAWILQDAHRLTLEEFQQAFGEAWSRLKRRFLKVECWQSYREADGVRSQKAYQEGKAELARELLREEAKGDQPLYEEVNARNLEFTRIRLISLPLTDYLRYEMINYEIRRAWGRTSNSSHLPHPSPTISTSCCSTITPLSSTTTAPDRWATRSAAGSPGPPSR